MKAQVNEAIANFITENRHSEITTVLCRCGAVTMSSLSSADSIAFLSANAPFIGFTLEGVTQNCNHCANNWGVDIVDHSVEIAEIEEQIEELEQELEEAHSVTVRSNLEERLEILRSNLEALENN